MQDSKALTPTEKVLICLSVHLIVVHEPAADLRDLLVVGGGQHEPAELPHARGLHVEGPVHGGGVRLSPGEVAVLPRQLLMVTGHTGHLASPVSQLNLNQFAATSPAQPSPALHRPLAFTSPPDSAATYGIGCHQLRTIRPFITKMIGTTFSLVRSACTGLLM